MTSTGFFAFPSASVLVVDHIRSAVQKVAQRASFLAVETWEELDIAGQFIASEVLRQIDARDLLIADISRLNFNVVYEVGYAIGKGKPILLVKHRALQEQSPTIQDVGIFDTLGYKHYATADELAAYLADPRALRPIHLAEKRNEKSPIYLVQPKMRTDYDGLITAAVKKSHLYFRSFDPTESTRLSGPDAGHVQYVINPAFAPALGLSES